MSSESPSAVLYSSDGYELAVVSGSSIPANTRGLLVEGSDGTNSRFITVDSSGRVTIVGAGTAGTPAGGVLSIQGVAGGQAVPVSGTITITDPAEGLTGSAVPATAIYIGADVVSAAPTLSAGNLAGLTLTTAGRLIIDGSQVTQPVAGTGTAGSPAGGVLTVQGSSSGTPIPVTAVTNKAATSSVTSVAASVTSVQLLASNSNRIGASIYNDGAGLLYVKLGTTASTSSFTIKIMSNAYWEVPNDYTGEIDGIWDRTGATARITEMTP